MIQPKYNKQNNTIFLGFDSIEINLVLTCFIPLFIHTLQGIIHVNVDHNLLQI